MGTCFNDGSLDPDPRLSCWTFSASSFNVQGSRSAGGQLGSCRRFLTYVRGRRVIDGFLIDRRATWSRSFGSRTKWEALHLVLEWSWSLGGLARGRLVDAVVGLSSFERSRVLWTLIVSVCLAWRWSAGDFGGLDRSSDRWYPHRSTTSECLAWLLPLVPA